MTQVVALDVEDSRGRATFFVFLNMNIEN